MLAADREDMGMRALGKITCSLPVFTLRNREDCKDTCKD